MLTRCSSSRLLFVDALKAIAAQLIVLHHLAFYGPMSDVAYSAYPELIDWLFNYGRIAVQVFLVVGGFLAARTLAPEGWLVCDRPIQVIRRRYIRLAGPFLCALGICMLTAVLARQWMADDSIPGVPQPWQLLSHVFLIQGLVGQEALTAGAWYVAIDFQLFALMLLVLWGVRAVAKGQGAARKLGMLVVVGLLLLSLFCINGKDAWADYALYYFGAYGLGATAYWLAQPGSAVRWPLLIALLATTALVLDFRIRIAVALAVAVALALVHWKGGLSRWPDFKLLGYLSRISYSLFLIHFPVCLLVNASFARLEVDSPHLNLAGMVLAWVLSMVSAAVFHRYVEVRVADWAAAFGAYVGAPLQALLRRVRSPSQAHRGRAPAASITSRRAPSEPVRN